MGKRGLVLVIAVILVLAANAAHSPTITIAPNHLYEGQEEHGEIRYVISDRDWERVKQLLVAHLSTFGTPLIMVEDGDYKGKRELYLRHALEGTELDREYREKTLELVFYLWDRPVHVESVVDGENVIFNYDGHSHQVAKP